MTSNCSEPLPPEVQKVYLRYGLIVKTEEDADWYKWNVDGAVTKKIARELEILNQ
jgi:hypothetical protein